MGDQQQRFPDLSFLESVEVGNPHPTWATGPQPKSVIVAAVVMIAVVFAAILVSMADPSSYPTYLAVGRRLVVIAGVAAIAGAIGFVLGRMLDRKLGLPKPTDCYWKTDGEGLTIMNSDGVERAVAWQDVESVRTDRFTEYSVTRPIYEISARGNATRVEDSSVLLYASIWQHLRRRGIAGDSDLRNPDARRLWAPPSEGEIDLGRSVRAYVTAAIWAVFLCVAAYTFCEREYVQSVAMLLIALPALYDAIVIARYAATTIVLDPTRLYARGPLGSVSIPWEQVRSATWRDLRGFDTANRYLLIRAGNGRAASIRVSARNEASLNAAYYALSRLREAGIPVSEPSTSQSAEPIRMNRQEA